MADEDDGEPIEGLSFWEPGGYKKTTKRITDGNQLCNEIVEMVQERCEMEQTYARHLKNWSKRWNSQIDKGPEYGSMESAWKAVLTAAERDADVHLRVKDNLVATVQNEVRRWQKDNFHKGLMSLHLKEKKEMDEEFKKAQKPWVKKLKLVEKYKQEYHVLCQKLQSAELRSNNTKNDPAVSEDQRAKTLDEINKLTAQRQSAKGSYEDALRDLNSYNARYMEDMKEVYAKCQKMENERLDFFKNRLKDIHQSLDLSNDVTVKQIFADYLFTVEGANAKSDLKWWDMQRGIEMPMNWPQFEEWAPRTAPITAPSLGGTLFKQNGSSISGGTFKRKTDETPSAFPSQMFASPSQTIRSTTVTTTTITDTRPINEPTERNERNGMNSDGSSVQRPIAASRESLNRRSSSRESLQTPNKSPFDSDEEKTATPSAPVAAVRAAVSEPEKKSFDNPFNEPDWNESSRGGSMTQHDSSKSGVRVRALYTYGGEEADELSFKEGEVFEKIEERDEQGWCKGRKTDGSVGLFPADYVQPV